ncbi:MAG: hypothetical protein ACLRWL_10100 [Evtepia gabavorous]
MGRRGKKGGPMGGKWNISHSLQMRLALGYSCLIAVLLVLMNTYPLIMGQNLMFRSQQTALANQLVLITNTLTTADELTPETVEQAIGQLEELEVRRVLVTDGAGRVLYDTGEPSALGNMPSLERWSPPSGATTPFPVSTRTGPSPVGPPPR